MDVDSFQIDGQTFPEKNENKRSRYSNKIGDEAYTKWFLISVKPKGGGKLVEVVIPPLLGFGSA